MRTICSIPFGSEFLHWQVLNSLHEELLWLLQASKLFSDFFSLLLYFPKYEMDWPNVIFAFWAEN